MFNLIKSKKMKLFLAVLAVMSAAAVSSADSGSCGSAGKCCPGRDSSCLVSGMQSNGRYVDRPCYCDEGCLETGDCCQDYKEACEIKGKSSVKNTVYDSCSGGHWIESRLGSWLVFLCPNYYAVMKLLLKLS